MSTQSLSKVDSKKENNYMNAPAEPGRSGEDGDYCKLGGPSYSEGMWIHRKTVVPPWTMGTSMSESFPSPQRFVSSPSSVLGDGAG